MGQDKKQLTKLLKFVKELYDNPDNKEFAAGIQGLVLDNLSIEDRRDSWTEQINEIYEFCLKKNLREQAEDLYKDFPLYTIASRLADFYVDMENARRSNDFDGFGRFLYLQIELIVGTIICEPEFVRLYDSIRNLKPISRYDKVSKSSTRIDFIQNKKGNNGAKVRVTKDTVDKFLLLSDENCGKPIGSLGAIDKFRIVFYTVCHQATVSGWPNEDFETLSAIYNIRNHDAHAGANTTDRQKWSYDELLANKTKNYLRFLGFLLSFTKGISDNYPFSDELYDLAGISR